jgi:hypothetical protein
MKRLVSRVLAVVRLQHLLSGGLVAAYVADERFELVVDELDVLFQTF